MRKRNLISCQLVLLFVLLISTLEGQTIQRQSKTSSWSRGERALAGLYLAGSLIDAGQTIYGVRNGAVELNPLFGIAPSRRRIYVLKTLFGTGAIYLAHRTPDTRQRRTLLVMMNIIQWSAVLWNGMQPGIGVRMNF